MRMSMSKKIFAIVIMLLTIAVIIFLLGGYSIVRLNAEIASLTRRGNRAVNLNMMDKQMLGREVSIFKILSASDEKVMDAVISEEMAAQDRAMENELERYAANFSDNPTPEQRQRSTKIRKCGTGWIPFPRKPRN